MQRMFLSLSEQFLVNSFINLQIHYKILKLFMSKRICAGQNCQIFNGKKLEFLYGTSKISVPTYTKIYVSQIKLINFG